MLIYQCPICDRSDSLHRIVEDIHRTFQYIDINGEIVGAPHVTDKQTVDIYCSNCKLQGPISCYTKEKETI